jgi:hypothetical protein
MRLKSLSARNFTGTNFDVFFAPVTIITGENGAGKTAVPTALRLLFTGQLPPPIGIKGIYRYAGSPDQPGEMSLGAEMDDGRKIGLKWTRSAKGTVSCDGGIPLNLVMPPMLANPKSFWSKTGAERIQAILDCCPAQDLTGKIKARLVEIQTMPAKVRESVLAEVQGWIAKGADPAKLLDTLKIEAKSSADQSKAVAGAITGVTLAVTKPADCQAELESACNELAKLNVTQGNERGIHEKGLEQVKCTLDAYSRKHKETPLEHLLEFIESELQTISKDLRKLQPPAPTDDESEQLTEAQDQKAEYLARVNQWSAKYDELRKQAADFEILECCPVCKNKAKGWREKSLAALLDQKEQAQAAWNQAAAKKAELDATCIRLAKSLEAAQSAKKEYARTKAELEREAAALETDRDNIQDLMAEQVRLQDLLTKCGQVDTDALAKAVALRAKIGALQEQQAARAAYDRDMKQREKLEIELLGHQARADVLKSTIKIVVEEQAKAGEAAFSSVLGVARHFTDGLLNSPLEFVDGDLGRRVSAADRKRKGFVAPVGSWITHETFSDSEQRIAYIGFSIALATTAPIKLVIIDEMATLSDGRKVLFVDRLIQLVRKGIIDQAICIEPGADDYKAFETEEEVRLIRL